MTTALLRSILASVFFCCSAARAAPSIVVEVDCPALGAEPLAALESRANAELIVWQEPGTLVVACGNGVAEVSWHSLHGLSSRTLAPLSSDPKLTIDAVLESLDQLLNASWRSRAVLPAAPHAGETAPPAATTEPVVHGAASVGAATELWSTPLSLGPAARGELLLPSRFVLNGGAGVAWTLGAPLGVSGRLVKGFVGADYAIGDARRFRVGANVGADFLHAGGAGQSASNSGADVSVHVSYALPLAPTVQVVLRPALALRPKTMRVDLGTREAFRIPPFVAGLTLELRLGRL